MNKILSLAFLLISSSVLAQSEDETNIKRIFNQALQNGKSYEMLEHLTTKIGARLSGSEGAEKAVIWSEKVMKDFGFDSVWLQPVMVPNWVRGKKEVAKIMSGKKSPIEVNVCALGGSIGTGAKGIEAQVIEVKKLEELTVLGSEKIKGKIIFFNRPMDPTHINTFAAYGGAGDQRRAGASEAAKYGAVGVVVRSLGSNLEDYPHTGNMSYTPDVPKIPAIAISTRHAELLSASLKENGNVKFYFETYCEMLPDVQSYNVIGELKGSKFPDEFIVVGGHLDSWDLGQGAHDDGAGCVQSIEVLRILKELRLKPNRTIRAVMFMNEENGLRGGREYARQAELKKEKHIAAMESDRGGFTPRGFTMSGTDEQKAKIRSWKSLLEPYGLADMSQPGGGADIGPLAGQGTTLIGYLPDSQRYFNYHHTSEDTFDKVDKRELELGAASMAALTYLIDKYGLK
ncbi:MAG: M20/M25/M40 family metallo-hydrolase [Flammeovirgaceae bacterium]|nr:M20/M25/M40 family metallo-hydrolase [Flammeovirgaceae bacterium]